MLRKIGLIALTTFLLLIRSPAQTTNGLITGTITDSSGAVVPGAQVDVINQGTGQHRTAVTDNSGSYIVPQLPPGIYDISARKQGFATQNRPNIPLLVNQSDTLNFALTISSTSQTVQVTGAPPVLNTTSATLSDVVGHETTVDLPLNGREFTELTLLTPGAAPIENSQQSLFTVALGAGGISPSVNGQRGEQNNFTMDGLLNNATFTNIWAISPPPDALQEFNVQSHITDAQFAISSGANINIVTRSGTNTFHGSAWEFARNSIFDGREFFETQRLPYSQNQYGVYFGGPVLLPHFNGRNRTWFSAYWEGFRSSQTLSYFGTTLTAAERTGDFSAQLGPQVGTDSLGRPEYENEIYDPATSRPDPINPGAVLRDPFPGNIIPAGRINAASPLILKQFFALPNLNVPPTTQPNIQFPGTTATASDSFGIRIDQRLSDRDTLFGRFNRANMTYQTPEQLPGYSHFLNTPAISAAVGYTRLFGSKTILNFRYGYTDTNIHYNDEPAGAAFTNSIDYSLSKTNGVTDYGPEISISNGYNGVSQMAYYLGPEEGSDFHLDLSKVIGHHTLGVGGMFYHVFATGGTIYGGDNFTQNATSQGALAGLTGNGAASFMLGLPDSIVGYAGDAFETNTTNWYGGYAQDQWKASKNMTITAGLRYDFLGPTNLHQKIVTGLDIYTGQFLLTAPYAPLGLAANAPKNYYYNQYNGFEPRFGIAYQASNRTVLRTAFAMLDDHNNNLVQAHGDISGGWPTVVAISDSLLNRDLPTVYQNNLPSSESFLNPVVPYIGVTADPRSKIPYTMEFNAGIEQQLSNSTVMTLNYVGSLTRHQYLNVGANTAPILGPGSLASRGQPFPQYGGGAIEFSTNVGNASYNAMQAEFKATLASGLFFRTSYTWSKSMDLQSDPYIGYPQNFYDLGADWGPSDFNLSQLFVLSGVYALPVGKNKSYLSSPNGLVQALLGNWNIGSIVSLHSGEMFDCQAAGDVANSGSGTQRCDEIGPIYAGAGFQKSYKSWVNPASFTTIEYTFGTESRNDLVGPPYKDVDFNVFKLFPIGERLRLQLRAEAFNLFNHTNFGNPTNNIQSSSFGAILSSYASREVQFAGKIEF